MEAVFKIVQQESPLISEVIVILRHLLLKLVESQNQHIYVNVCGLRQLILALRTFSPDISDELLLDGISLRLIITHALYHHVVIVADEQASSFVQNREF